MSLSYGTVTARFVSYVGDGPDEDFLPDEVPLSGYITFTPNVSQMKFPSDDTPKTAVLQTIVCPVIDGNLYSSGITEPTEETPLGVTLLASSQPDAIPDRVQYNVSFNLKNVRIQLSDLLVEVEADSTVDLTNILPSSPNPGEAIIVSSEERILAQQAAEEAQTSQETASTHAEAAVVSADEAESSAAKAKASQDAAKNSADAAKDSATQAQNTLPKVVTLAPVDGKVDLANQTTSVILHTTLGEEDTITYPSNPFPGQFVQVVQGDYHYSDGQDWF